MTPSGLYRDTRFGGQLYAYRPDDWEMRVPNNILQCVTFLGVRPTNGPRAGNFICLGTAFMVVLEEEGAHFSCLVTAKHVVDEAQRGGFDALEARFNRKNGTAEIIKLQKNDQWIRYTNKAVDLAVIAHSIDFNAYECAAIPMHMFANTFILSRFGIGPGDELFTVGLFALKEGKQRNIPIVRSGIISAMPNETEPFTKDGETYHAYLAEMRSIGGLSGSPVFVLIDHRSRIVPQGEVVFPIEHDWSIFCLGVVRGHWELEREASDSVTAPETEDVRLGFSKGENLNVGIAIVTPSQYVLNILNHDKVKKLRKELIDMQKKETESYIVEDSAQLLRKKNADDQTNEPLTKKGFDEVLRRVSSKVSEPESRKTETSE